jgi:two-component system sensor histidine kinase UhpB
MERLQEDERRRIAREIHDELGQRLTALRLDLGLLRTDIRQRREKAAETRIGTMLGLIDETIATVRRLATDLRPAILDDFGLRAAVEQELATFSERTGIAFTLTVVPEDLTISGEVAAALYRIAKESLTNAARHSGATNIDVRLALAEGRIELELHDNGRGISKEEAESVNMLGLLGLRERAYAFGGEVVIDGIPGKGTRVFVSIPYETPRSG